MSEQPGSAASDAAQRPGAQGGGPAGLAGGATFDGNALAGPLREIFAVDLTTASHRCPDCGRRDVVASLRVYLDAPGLVARCVGCDAVTLRLVRGPDRAWLDLRGVVEIDLAAADTAAPGGGDAGDPPPGR